MLMAGLLTCSSFACLPVSMRAYSDIVWHRIKELTAAGQFRTRTGFPFNPRRETENQSAANVSL